MNHKKQKSNSSIYDLDTGSGKEPLRTPWARILIFVGIGIILVVTDSHLTHLIFVGIFIAFLIYIISRLEKFKELFWIEKWEKRGLQKDLYREQEKVAGLEESIESIILNSRQELEQAREVQESLLPHRTDFFEELKFSVTYRPSISIGGDLYDIFPINKRFVVFLIADASGHGVGAALMSVMLKLHIERYREILVHASEADSINTKVVARFIESINRAMHDSLQSGRFASFLIGLACQETGSIIIGNAGHNPPLIWQKEEGHAREMTLPANLVLGILPDAEFEMSEVQLKPGDKILFYTDGYNESKNLAGKEWGIHNLLHTFRENADEDPDSITRQIELECKTFCGGAEQDDDQAMIILEYVK